MSGHAAYAALVVAHAACVLERLEHEDKHGDDLHTVELRRREAALLNAAEEQWQALKMD